VELITTYVCKIKIDEYNFSRANNEGFIFVIVVMNLFSTKTKLLAFFMFSLKP
jgi:hypothetical protein